MEKLPRGRDITLGRPENRSEEPISRLDHKFRRKQSSPPFGRPPKFDPPSGDHACYKKLATTYAIKAKDIDTAAKKETSGRPRRHSGSCGSCMGCHEAHKPEDRTDGLTVQEHAVPGVESERRALASFFNRRRCPLDHDGLRS